jgi:hypothetical protein
MRVGPSVRAITLVCLAQASLSHPSGLAAAGAAAEIIDRVLAVVGGVVITQSDVNLALELGLVSVGQSEDRTRAVLSKLVDRQLILTEVDRYAPPDPAADAVEREVLAIRAKFTSADAYNSALARGGVDEPYLRRTLRDELRIRAYLEQRFTIAAPTEEEVSRYYREHPGEFERGSEVLPLETARPQIVQALIAARREPLVNDWVAGLRRRAEIIDLSVARQ